MKVVEFFFNFCRTERCLPCDENEARGSRTPSNRPIPMICSVVRLRYGVLPAVSDERAFFFTAIFHWQAMKVTAGEPPPKWQHRPEGAQSP